MKPLLFFFVLLFCFVFHFAASQQVCDSAAVLSWHKLDNDLLDSGSRGLSGAYITGPGSFVAGTVGSALSITASNGAFSIPNYPMPTFANFSICFFVKTAETSTTARWFTYGNNVISIENFVSPKIKIGAQLLNTTTTFATNAWIHVCLVQNDATQATVLYRNGVPVTLTRMVPTNTSGTLPTLDVLRFAADETGASPVASLDQILIYSRAITVNEVQILSSGKISCCGVASDVPTVCNGRGLCQTPDLCQCNITLQYSGNNCSLPICNGKTSTDPTVCSAHGACTSPNFCSCSPSFTGTDCQTPICFGVPASNPNTCSGHGTCSNADTCSCSNPVAWFGVNCEVTSCYGVNSNAPSTCSGHGLCSSKDNCTCNAGYAGDRCHIVNCFGFTTLDPGVCSGHGNCIGPNVCNCSSSCITGDLCDFNKCNLVTITADPTSKMAWYSGVANLVVIELSAAIPASLQSKIRCVGNGGATVFPTIPYSTANGNRKFNCTLNSDQDFIGITPVSIYLEDRVISANSLAYHTLWSTIIRVNSNTSLANYSQFDLTVQLDADHRMPEGNKLLCRLAENINLTIYYTFLPAIPADSSNKSFICFVATGRATRSVTLALFYNNSVPIFASSVFINVGWVEMGTLSHGLFSYGAGNTNEAFYPNVRLNNATFPSGLANRLRCKITGQNLVNLSPAYEKNLGVGGTCRAFQSMWGTQNISLWIDVGGGRLLPLSLNTVPIVFVQRHNVSSYSRFGSLLGQNHTLTFVYSDDIEPYDPALTRYECSWFPPGFSRTNRSSSPAIQINNNTFMCNITSPSAQILYDISVHVVARLTETYVTLQFKQSLFAYWEFRNSSYPLPFIANYTSLSTPTSYDIRVFTARPMITAINLFCEYFAFDGYRRVNATSISGNSVLCSIARTSFPGNTDHVDIFLRIYDTYNTTLAIVPNNVTLVLLQNPVKLSRLISSPDFLSQNNNLTFNGPAARSNVKLTITGIPAFNPTVNLPFVMNCFFPEGSLSYCNLAVNYVFSHVPIQINVVMKAEIQQFEVSTLIDLPRIFYKDDTVISREFPFIAETSYYTSLPLQVLFSGNKLLNPTAPFYLEVNRTTNEQLPIIFQYLDLKNFSCNILSKNIDEILTVRLMVTLDSETVSMSNASVLRFGRFQMSPAVTEVRTASSHTLMLRDSKLANLIPTKYAGQTFSVSYVYNRNSMESQCTLTNGVLVCQKSAIAPNSFTRKDIDVVGVTVNMGGMELMKLNHSFVWYTQNKVNVIYPRAALKNAATNISFAYNTSTLDTNLAVNPVFLATTNASATAEYAGAKTDTLSHLHLLAYSGAIQSNDIHVFYPYARFPDVDSVNASLSVQHSVYNYFVTPGLVFVSPSQVLLLYTKTSANVLITLNTMMYTSEIKSNIFCRVASTSSPALEYHTTTATITTIPNSQEYTCAVNTEIEGRTNISLWYKDPIAEFQISSNNTEIVLVSIGAITSIDPFAVRTHFGRVLNIATNIKTNIDYGNDVQYFCSYAGVNLAATRVLANVSNGVFRCFINGSTAQNVGISLIMAAKGFEKVITNEAVQLAITDKYFLEPSHGHINGGDSVLVRDYVAPHTPTINPPDFVSCVTDDGNRKCLTPALLTPWESRDVLLNSVLMDFKYVAIGRVSINPPITVFPAGGAIGTFNLGANGSVSNAEGSFYFSIGEYTPNVQRVVIGSAFPAMPLNAMVDGAYDLELYYQHPSLKTIRSAVQVSNQAKTYFIQPRTISYTAASTNIGPTVTPFTIVVSHSGSPLPVALTSNVYCTYASQDFVATLVSGNIYSCSVSNAINGVVNLELVYKAGNAFGGRVLISSNTLKLVFASPTSLSTIVPHITVDDFAAVTMQLGDADVFANNVTYQCRYRFKPVTFPATRTGSTISCTLERYQTHTAEQVELWIAGSTNKYISYGTGATFYWTNYVALLDMVPFLSTYVMQVNTTVTRNVTLQTVDTIFTDKSLLCKYSSSVDGVKYSPAVYIGPNTVNCTLQKRTFTTATEIVTVSLFVNITSSYNFDLSVSPIQFIFMRQDSIVFDITSATTTNIGSLMRLTASLPYQFTHLNYTVRMNRALGSTTTSMLACTITFDLKYVCVIPNPFSSYNPVKMDLSLLVRSARNGASVEVPIVPYVYYEQISLMRVYPYAFQFSDSIIMPRTVVFESSKAIPREFVPFFTCESYSVLANSTQVFRAYSHPTKNDSFVACDLRGFGIQESVQVSLKYNEAVISNRAARITYVSALQATSIPRGTTAGGQSISVILPPEPTLWDGKYDIRMQILDRARVIPMNCSTVDYNLTCVAPNLDGNLHDYLVYKSVQLYFDDLVALRVLTYAFFNPPNITRVVPSKEIDRLLQGKGLFVTFHGVFPLFVDDVIVLGYQIPSKNYTELALCSRVESIGAMARVITCPYPANLPAGYTGPLSYFMNYAFGLQALYNDMIVTANFAPQFDYISRREFIVGQEYIANITGRHFVQNGKFRNIRIRFRDSFFNKEILAEKVEDTYITFRTPILFDEPVTYPRILQMSLIYEHGLVYANSLMNISFTSLPKVNIRPRFGYINSRLNNLRLTNLPALQLKEDYVLFSYELYDSSSFNSYVGPLLCTAPAAGSLLCNMTTALPPNPISLELRIVARRNTTLRSLDGRVQTNIEIPFRVIRPPVVNSLYPLRVIRGASKVRVTGPSFPPSETIKVRCQVTPVLRNSIQEIDLDAVAESENVISFVAPNIIGDANMTAISFSDGNDWAPYSAQFSVVDTIRISSVENPEDDFQASAFTYKRTLVRVYGSGFTRDMHLMRIRFSGSLLPTVIFNATQVNLQYVLSTQYTMEVPEFLVVTNNANLNLVFPFAGISLQISFDGGFNYFTVDNFVFLDKFRAPLIANLEPKIIPRDNTFVLLRGNFFVNLTECIVIFSSIANVTVPFTLLDANTVNCSIPASVVATNKTSIGIALRNQKEYSSAKDLFLHNVPELVGYTPKQGLAVGGYPLTLVVKNLNPLIPAFIRLGSAEQRDECILESLTANSNGEYTYSCPIVAHDYGVTSIEISYNKRNWFGNSGFLFTFLNCPPGYAASSFSQPCLPCNSGTFKPANVTLNQCLACANSTYNDQISATSCKECPIFSISMPAAKSYFECVCMPKYFVNPKFSNGDLRCVNCPIGGACADLNTTMPIALPGFWQQKRNPFSFDQCSPLIACLGGVNSSCAAGYQGDVCGRCSPDYYKFSGKCEKCQPGSWWRLLVGLIILGLLTLVFFAMSSVKVSHVSSIAIAFSFTQIVSLLFQFGTISLKMPTSFSTATSVTSLSNFNLDFLSLECVIPGLPFEVKWGIFIGMPYAIGLCFLLLYVFGEIRSCLAWRIGKCIRFDYMSFLEEPEEEKDAEEKQKKTLSAKVLGLCHTLYRLMHNGFVWARNFTIWFFKQGLNSEEKQIFRDKIINSYCNFVSFAYTFIMTTTSEVFVCNLQSDDRLTLNASPNITCFRDTEWFILMPFAVVNYLVINGGIILLYLYMFLIRDQLSEKNTSFRRRFKFTLQRFKHSYYYWDLVCTLRKTILSILAIFFRAQAVITLAVFVLFLGLIFQAQFVPFKKKFHNLMEYCILLATLIVAFCGLLFYVDVFPTDGTRIAIQVIAIGIIIGACAFVALFIVWDALTRRKKDKKRTKREQRKLEAEIALCKAKGLPYDHLLKQRKTQYDAQGKVIFRVMFVQEETESEEDTSENLNQIIEDVISWRRLKRNLLGINKKRKKAQNVIVSRIRSISRKKSNAAQ